MFKYAHVATLLHGGLEPRYAGVLQPDVGGLLEQWSQLTSQQQSWAIAWAQGRDSLQLARAHGLSLFDLREQRKEVFSRLRVGSVLDLRLVLRQLHLESTLNDAAQAKLYRLVSARL